MPGQAAEYINHIKRIVFLARRQRLTGTKTMGNRNLLGRVRVQRGKILGQKQKEEIFAFGIFAQLYSNPATHFIFDDFASICPSSVFRISRILIARCIHPLSPFCASGHPRLFFAPTFPQRFHPFPSIHPSRPICASQLLTPGVYAPLN